MSSARRLALGRLVSLTAASAAYIALISALYQHTGSAAWVSAALFAGVTGSVAGSRPWSWIKITLLVILALFILYLYVSNS